MREAVTRFAIEIWYLITHSTVSDVLDILLVAVVFFVVLQALRQRRALQILRGAIVFGILVASLLGLLPLTTFNWLLRGLLLVSLVALPLLFQDELRQALTGLGQVGRLRKREETLGERFISTLVSAVSLLSSERRGALLVLEGGTPLNEIVATGIPVEAGQLTSELLLTIFHPKTPLHDGAVIVRGDRLAAAGCILPVQTEGTGDRHLGTRHRAALGMSSQAPDAMVLVVSEENGRISVARAGRLHEFLSTVELEEWLIRYIGQFEEPRASSWEWLIAGGLSAVLQNGAVALGLATLAWVAVAYQTNPPEQVSLPEVPLARLSPSPDLVLTSELPDAVDILVQATRTRLPQLDVDSLQAVIDLSGLPAGVHRVPVEVSIADPQAQVIEVTPGTVDVTLEERVSVSLTPTIDVLDPGTLPPGYTLGELSFTPAEVTVRGPRSLVDQISEIQSSINLNGRTTEFQESVNVQVIDEEGEQIAGLQPVPERVLVRVPVERTFFTREIAVQPDLALSAIPSGYALTEVLVTPSEVTLAGEQSLIEEIGDFLVTAPISLTNVREDLTLQAPLILPPGLAALDEQGESIQAVTVEISVDPVTDYYVLTQAPQLTGLRPDLSAQINPPAVSALLIGPEPLIRDIQTSPGLIQIEVNLAGFAAGTHTVPLTVQSPIGVQVEVFPADVQVVLEEVTDE